tara:strand:- start:7463 stop:8878 length:1416 start_codon:yes stop_codon:yes gene_type:complete
LNNKELAFTPAWKLQQLIFSKEISPVELTELYFERINSLNSKLNAYLTLNYDDALKSAKSAETEIINDNILGPLHGIPIAIKDMEPTQGLRTTLGSLTLDKNIPDKDSIMVEKIKKSGAIILGKTNTSEFGAIGTCENNLGPPCKNPWDTTKTSGGSSGGSAAAIASGMAAITSGGDGGGSIRIPASYCGTYGIKPTQGRVAKYSATPNWIAQNGPITRTVKDAAFLLQTISGYHKDDKYSVQKKVPDFLEYLKKDLKNLRIGWSSDFGHIPVSKEVENITSEAAKKFESFGCSVEKTEFKIEQWAWDSWWTTHNAHAYSNNGKLLESNPYQLTWYYKRCLKLGKSITGEAYGNALKQRTALITQFEKIFEKFDLILSPTMPDTAFSIENYPEKINNTQLFPDPWYGTIQFTHPINTIGNPAASIPCGLTSNNMPVGLHIIGRPWDEITILAASAAFEQSYPWADTIAPIS